MDTVQPFDLQRMIVGDAPPLFYLEILVRTLIIYVYSLVLMRWLGSRTIGQLSTVEFLLVIALGSAVGDGMFYPEVPLLHALAVITLVVVANKGLDLLIARNVTAERILDGRPYRVVENGVIDNEALRRSDAGHSEILQQLRQHGVRNLGEVEHAYVEPDGVFTVFLHEDNPRPGLPIVPPWEIERPPEVEGDQPAAAPGLHACMRCGTTADVAVGTPPGACPHCDNRVWTVARPEPQASGS